MTEKISDKEVAAALCGCSPDELMGFRSRSNGDLSVIAPTGQKFVYAKVLVDGQREIMEAKAKPEPKPRRKAPATRRRAPAKDNSAKTKASSG